jgi:rare lipoprotein A
MSATAEGPAPGASRARPRGLIFAATLGAVALLASNVAITFAEGIQPGQKTVSTVEVTARARASWYGTGSVGKVTASGILFSRVAKTAAHRTLPFGTRVEVTNLRNGKKLTVVVTDRGPYVPGRDIDVSQTAARKLGFESRGVTTVRMRMKVPVSKGLVLVGVFPSYALWIPPRRASLSPAPVILRMPFGSRSGRPTLVSVAHPL